MVDFGISSAITSNIVIDYSDVFSYAMIKDGYVENTCVWSGNEQDWTPPEGYLMVKIEEGVRAGPGWRYENGVFIEPVVQE